MIQSLRRRLTAVCAVITGLILTLMAGAALLSSEAQMKKASAAAFQSNLNNIVNKLRSDYAISNSWLAQAESGEEMLIHIEDNGTPLSFPGAWEPPTGRKELIEAAQTTAREQYGFDVKQPPGLLLEAPSAFFELRDLTGNRYLAGVALISSQKKSWQSVTLLRDMRAEESAVWSQRILFGGIVVAGILLLAVWSSFFVGRMLRPIEENRKKQVSFVAAASHELRSPLAVIQASASVLRAGGDAERFSETIDRECGRMARLIDDLLLLAGSDAKTWSVAFLPVDADVLLVETAESFYPVAAKRKQTLTLTLPNEPLPPLCGDEQRLKQVLSVLLDNAMSYTPEGGKITLRAKVAGRSVVIEVADNGGGILPEQVPHIFDRFYRADGARSDKAHFGLGLSIAQELVRLHHGKLVLRETGEAGTVFAVELPAGSASLFENS